MSSSPESSPLSSHMVTRAVQIKITEELALLTLSSNPILWEMCVVLGGNKYDNYKQLTKNLIQ